MLDLPTHSFLLLSWWRGSAVSTLEALHHPSLHSLNAGSCTMDRKRKVSGRQAATRDLQDGMSSDEEDMEVPRLSFCHESFTSWPRALRCTVRVSVRLTASAVRIVRALPYLPEIAAQSATLCCHAAVPSVPSDVLISPADADGPHASTARLHPAHQPAGRPQQIGREAAADALFTAKHQRPT